MNKYFWNFNEHEEVWQNSCPTIEDCIEEAKWEKEDREIAENHVFIGDVEPYKPFIDVEYLIDDIQEQAYEEHGECCEGWLDGLKKEQKKILEERLNGGLGSALKKLYKGLNGERIYENYKSR